MPRRCKSRHRKSWVLGSSKSAGLHLWCYECGAIRANREGAEWIYPVGADGENPTMQGSDRATMAVESK